MRRSSFVEQCEQRLGLCLADYRATTLERTVNRMMRRFGCARIEDLLTVLEDDAHRQAFIDELAVNVTAFFRDPKAFRYLKHTFLPELLKRRRATRFWSAGCATGQEAYSLAMLLEETDPEHKGHVDATDIDQSALTKARSRLYDPDELAGVNAARRRAFFVRQGHAYQVCDAVSDRVTFRRHDLLREPFPTDYYDLIAFRNVAIHFARDVDRRLHVRFVDALRAGGILFLGGAEGLFAPEPLGLEPVGWCCYEKTGDGPSPPSRHGV